MTRSLYALAFVACLVFAQGALSAPVAAQQDTAGPVDEVFDSSDDGGLLDTVGSYYSAADGVVSGIRSRIVQAVTHSVGVSESPDAEQAATDVADVVADHRSDLQAYANARSTADGDYDALRFEFTIDGETATRYVTADVVDGNYEGATMVADTDRSVDESCELEGAAARNADEELQTFVDTYVEPGDNVSESLFTRISTQYGGNIDCSFL